MLESEPNRTSNSMSRPIILTGGGTGGHIYPLVAVAEQLEDKKYPFIYIGSVNGREKKIVEDLGYDFIGINTGKWRRYLNWRSFWQNLVDIIYFCSGFFQALAVIIRTRARVVFSKGGFVALPVVLAAFCLGRKIIIHESDSVMGLVNRFSSRLASVVYTAFDPKVFAVSDKRFRRVGIPLRQFLERATELKVPRKPRPLVLVIGGIQGSATLNRYVRGSLSILINVADIVHITGETDFETSRKLLQELPVKFRKSYRPFPSIERELPYYLRVANLVVSRAGATIIAESALFAKPMYLIPLPSSAGNHQVKNARILAEMGAVEFSEEYQLTPSKFSSKLIELLANTSHLDKMGKKLHQGFYQANAADEIANELINYAKNK